MKKFVKTFFVAFAALTLFSCQKGQDFGSPVGKYWFGRNLNNNLAELTDLATKPGVLFGFGNDAAIASLSEEVSTSDASFVSGYQVTKPKQNQYRLVLDSDDLTLEFHMIADDFAKVNFITTSTGKQASTKMYVAVLANVKYEEPEDPEDPEVPEGPSL